MIKQSNVSITEIDFITKGCNIGVRNDGRDVNDIRSILVENNIFPHVNGSSRLKLGHNTDIICSVKAEVTEYDSEVNKHTDQGIISVNVDISPACQLKNEDRKISEFSILIGEQLQRYYNFTKH